jgi:hypothetical protein
MTHLAATLVAASARRQVSRVKPGFRQVDKPGSHNETFVKFRFMSMPGVDFQPAKCSNYQNRTDGYPFCGDRPGSVRETVFPGPVGETPDIT